MNYPPMHPSAPSFHPPIYHHPQGPPPPPPIFPATCRNHQKLLSIPEHDLGDFLAREFLTDRLTSISKYLWLAGRLYPPRPLHTQLLMGREILLTEQAELHLVWTKGRIFIKPFPRYLLDDHFRERYFGEGIDAAGTTTTTEREKAVARCARGFLHSYTALVAYESDFGIAKEKGLLPKDLEWAAWHGFARMVVDRPRGAPNVYGVIDERYWYGELRLTRLDKIYRYSLRDVLYGYSHETATSQYSDFFANHFGLLLAVLGYFVVVLTAMQVGLGDRFLQTDTAFEWVCYVFTVFSLLAPIAASALIMIMFLVLFLGHWYRTTRDKPRRLAAMGIMDQTRRKPGFSK